MVNNKDIFITRFFTKFKNRKKIRETIIAKIIRGKSRKTREIIFMYKLLGFLYIIFDLQKIIRGKSRKNARNNIYVLLFRFFDRVFKSQKIILYCCLGFFDSIFKSQK